MVTTQIAEEQRSALDYQRIEQAIHFLEKNFRRQPPLHEVAASIHMSEYHFQRLFSCWVGISPKRFLQFLTKEYAKKLLDESRNLLDVTYESGLSSPGRLHDLFISCEAVTPGEYKNAGDGLVITFGFHPSPFGKCLIGLTDRGICALIFVPDDNLQYALDVVKRRWRKAAFREAPAVTAPVLQRVFSHGADARPDQALHLFLSGTNFQIKVWEALLRIPPGSLVSYEDIAKQVGMPGASRAVGNAIGQNPIAYLIPCHRVIQKVGALGGYRWGATRKRLLIGWEAAQKYREA